MPPQDFPLRPLKVLGRSPYHLHPVGPESSYASSVFLGLVARRISILRVASKQQRQKPMLSQKSGGEETERWQTKAVPTTLQ